MSKRFTARWAANNFCVRPRPHPLFFAAAFRGGPIYQSRNRDVANCISKRHFCDKPKVTPTVSKFGADDSDSNDKKDSSNSSQNESQSQTDNNNNNENNQRPPPMDQQKVVQFLRFLRQTLIITSLIFAGSIYAVYFWSSNKLNKLEARRKELWQGKEGMETLNSIIYEYIINQRDVLAQNEISKLLTNKDTKVGDLFTDVDNLKIKMSVQGGYEVITPIYEANRIRIGNLHVKMGIKDPFNYVSVKMANDHTNQASIFDGFDYLSIELYPTNNRNNNDNSESESDSDKKSSARESGQPILLYMNDAMQKLANEFAQKHGLVAIAARSNMEQGSRERASVRALNLALLGLRDSIIKHFNLPYHIIKLSSIDNRLKPIIFYEKLPSGQNFPENSKNGSFRVLIEFPLVNENDEITNELSNKVLIVDMIKMDVTQDGFNIVPQRGEKGMKKNDRGTNYGRGCLVVGIKDKSLNNFESSIDEELIRFENWDGGDKKINENDKMQVMAKRMYQQVYSYEFHRTDL